MTLTIEAPAKVNLCLAVDYPPRDGYHGLESVFQAIDLHDTLTFEPIAGDGQDAADVPAETTAAGTRVELDCSALDVPVRGNLVFKAVDALEQAFGLSFWPGERGVRITVEKRIPAGGGLGGGSSDAAAAIRAFAQLNGIDVLDARCLSVARALGADVAFFLHGGAAFMAGRGDELVCALPGFPFPLVLMGDAEGVSTAAVYAAFDDDPPAAPAAEQLAAAMEAARPDPRALARLCANNLEPAACAAQPRLAQRVAFAKASPHVLNALVTGSGATTYAICADEQEAEAFAKEAEALCDWVRVARACGSS